jgi:hypothetical protein
LEEKNSIETLNSQISVIRDLIKINLKVEGSLKAKIKNPKTKMKDLRASKTQID